LLHQCILMKVLTTIYSQPQMRYGMYHMGHIIKPPCKIDINIISKYHDVRVLINRHVICSK
jgi:hypothetical protein